MSYVDWRKQAARRKARNDRRKERQRTRRTLRVLAPYLAPQWRGLAMTALMLVAATFASLLTPWPLKFLLDEVLVENAQGGVTPKITGSITTWLIAIAAAIGGIALLKALLQYGKTYLLAAMSQRIGFHIRVALYEAIQRHSLTFHQKQRTGELITTVTKDVDKVQELVTEHLIDGVSNFLTLAGMVGIFSLLDWQLSVAMSGLIPIMWLTTAYFRKVIKDRESTVRAKEGELTSIAQETISSIRLVKALGREAFESRRFAARSGEQVDATMRVMRTEALFTAFLSVILGVATGALVWLAANRVLAGVVSIGTLIVFADYIKNLQGPTRSLAKFAAKMSKTAVRASKIVDILDEEPAVRDMPGAWRPEAFRGHIRFENVSFGYEPRRPVLKDVSFEVAPGQVLAIVGSTGAGKSTIASLVPRLYDPTGGRILIDGEDIRSYTLEGLRDQIGVVLQESVLFQASAAENIAYGRPSAPPSEIVEAAKAAYAHEFITELPEGYDSMIGERGATLSGGQRQRVAIARALVRNAPILILDEPTTGLDATAERTVLDALDRLMDRRTTIVIAHRLSTIRRADKILVLEHGRIVEAGTHDELVALGGRYYEMHELQSERPQSPASASAAEPEPVEADPAPESIEATTEPEPVVEVEPIVEVAASNGDRAPAAFEADSALFGLPLLEIKNAYDLGEWRSLTRLRGGKNRHWHLTTRDGDYFIRGSRREKTIDGVHFEHALLEHLRAGGMTVPQPLQTVDGRPLVHLDRIYTVTRACAGEPFEPGNAAQIAAAGATLARYHDLTRTFAPPVPSPEVIGVLEALERRLAEFDAQRLEHSTRSPGYENLAEAGLSLVHAHAKQTAAALRRIVPALDTCVAHMGFRRGSLLFAGPEVAALMDLDSSRRELRALDLAVAIHDWAKVYRGDDDPDNKVGLDLDVVGLFMDGYRSGGDAPSEQDLEAIPLLMMARRLTRALGRFIRVLGGAVEQDHIDKIGLELRRVRWLQANDASLRQALRGRDAAFPGAANDG